MYNNKNRSKIIVFLLITVYVASAVYFYLSFGAGGGTAAFSTYNGDAGGGSLFYDTLHEMGYPVARYHNALNAYADASAVQVVVEPGIYIADADGPLEWIIKGGRLIWLDDARRYLSREGFRLEEIYGDFTVYRYGAGHIVTGPGVGLSNEALYADATAGYIVEHILGGWKTDVIYFNEYYHGYASQPNLFRELPLYLQLLIIQTAFVAVFVLWHLGKRFGKPLMYGEETERDENEYILTLANIFENSGKGNAVINIYLRHFLNKCRAAFGAEADVSDKFDTRGLITRWNENNMPYADALAECLLNEDDFNTKTKNGGEAFIKRVESFKKLIDILDKSRI